MLGVYFLLNKNVKVPSSVAQHLNSVCTSERNPGEQAKIEWLQRTSRARSSRFLKHRLRPVSALGEFFEARAHPIGERLTASLKVLPTTGTGVASITGYLD